ncbi:MAG TPA: MFS transporter [Methanocorpusculum sp.]|nr:MFS transporter [Methanocorpusculum sp.]
MAATNRILVLTATSIGALINPLLSTMLILAMPAIGDLFSVSVRDLGWLSTAFILANAVCLVPGAWFVDRFGYKKSFITGCIISAISCILAIFSPSYPVLIASRIITGAGISLCMITSIAILTRIFPKNKRGFVIGINTAMVYVGLSIGPVLGGFLTEFFGWQSLFIFVPPVVLSGALIMGLFLKEEFTEPVEKFDKVGALLYAFALVSLMYGLSTITDNGSIFFVIAGLLLGAVFVWYELRQKAPILHIRLFFENKRFARSSYAALLNYAAAYSVTYMVSLYLQSVGALSALQAGLVMLFMPVVQVITTPVAGKLADRIDPKYLVTIGMILTIAGLITLAALGFFGTEFITYIAGAQLLMGLGASLFSAPNTTAIMSSVPKKEYSTASGVVAVVRQAGMLLSMAICMASISFIVGGAEMLGPAMHAEFISAMQAAMLISAGLAVIGVFFSWFRGALPEEVEE